MKVPPRPHDEEGTLVCSLTPSGRIDVHTGGPGEGPPLPTSVKRRIVAAFDAGRGAGLLHMGAGEVATDLHPTLAYWRDFGRAFVARACAATDPTDPRHTRSSSRSARTAPSRARSARSPASGAGSGVLSRRWRPHRLQGRLFEFHQQEWLLHRQAVVSEQ
jgi:hypothetical protein